MASNKNQFAVQLVCLTDPKSKRPPWYVGLDGGNHVYLPAQLHPSAMAEAPAAKKEGEDKEKLAPPGREAYARCHKAGRPVAIFENGYYVDATWLREELKIPFSRTMESKTIPGVKQTITNIKLDAMAKLMVEAGTAFRRTRKHGRVIGVVNTDEAAVLLEVPVGAEVPEAANDAANDAGNEVATEVTTEAAHG